MKHQFKFQKILNLKEKEKDEAFALYQESVKKFESAAEHLYELLKKKEDLEQFQSMKLASGFSIQEIRHYQNFIGNLDKSIEHCQKLVMNARNRMNWHEEKLQESNIEMKKYEKMKEKSYQYYMHAVNETEKLELDEISAIQYFHRDGIR